MLSVVIPSLNEFDNLRVLLPSLEKAGANCNYEVLICLAPQNQDESENIKTGPHIRFLKCTKAGRAIQMNYGAVCAKGDVLIFLHADTRIPLDFFEAIQVVLAKGNQAGLFAFDFYPSSFLLSVNAYFTAKKGWFTGAGDQCLFLKQKVFHQLGGFNEKQLLMEDFDFFDRLRRAGVSYEISKTRLKVSARKYETNSYLRVNMVNFLLFGLYRLGAKPEQLKNIYCRLLRGPQVRQLR